MLDTYVDYTISIEVYIIYLQVILMCILLCIPVFRYILWDKVPELTSVRRNLQKLQSDLTTKQGVTGQIAKGIDKVRIMTLCIYTNICVYILHHNFVSIVVFMC